MKKITTYIAFGAIAILLVVTPLITKAVSLPESGGNPVSVQSCVDISGGIYITLASGSDYTLLNGTKDLGNGIKQYTYSCTSSTTYFVSWKPVNLPPTPSLPPVAQPELAKLEVLHKMPNTGVPRTYTSYQDGLSFGSNLTYQLVKNNLTSLLVEASPETGGSLSYAFAWTSDTKDTQKYTQTTVAALAKLVNFTGSNSFHFTVTDYYRGKYSMLVAFVRNNDGISAVPNMPVEVDDIIPIFLRFETKKTSTPPPVVCGNIVGNGPVVYLCEKETFTHADSMISLRPTSVSPNTATLQIGNAQRTVWSFTAVGQKLELLSSVNNQTIVVTYLGESAEGKAVLRVEPKQTSTCQHVNGVADQIFRVCLNKQIQLTNGTTITPTFATNDLALVTIQHGNQTQQIVLYRAVNKYVEVNGAVDQNLRLNYRGLETDGRVSIDVEQVSIM